MHLSSFVLLSFFLLLGGWSEKTGEDIGRRQHHREPYDHDHDSDYCHYHCPLPSATISTCASCETSAGRLYLSCYRIMATVEDIALKTRRSEVIPLPIETACRSVTSMVQTKQRNTFQSNPTTPRKHQHDGIRPSDAVPPRLLHPEEIITSP